MVAAYSWKVLAGLSLARQFPVAAGTARPATEPTPEDVAAVVEAIGPMQTQTARSAFLGLAARLPGVTHPTISAAYEQRLIVRSSTLRGTVHTSTPAQHRLTEAATRLGQRTLWNRTLKPQRVSLEEVWSGIETFAQTVWRTPAELSAHLSSRLAENDPETGHRLDSQAGRYFGFGHGGLLRRPLSGGWEGQGAPGYRTARSVLADGVERDDLFTDPACSMAQLVRLHLRCHGPATRRDIAWWSGVGLRLVDAALASLGEDARPRQSPDGADCWDLTAPPPGQVPDAGTHLLPEFDALLCGYHPRARDRFLTPEQHDALWHQRNGLLQPPLLHGNRICGWWRAEGGTAKTISVHYFEQSHRPSSSELDQAVEAAARAMNWTVTGVRAG